MKSQTAAGYTAALLAAHGGNLAMIRYIDETMGTAFIRDTRGHGGVTIAHVAAARGFVELLEYIREHPQLGPEFLKTGDNNGDPPVFAAAQSNQLGVVQWFRS